MKGGILYQTTKLFSPELPPGFGVRRLPYREDGPLVSVPERAMLEVLSDVGKLQSLEEAGHLVESMRNPRLQVLDTLFAHCTRIKVIRLARMFAEQCQAPWLDLVKSYSEKRGSDNRWTRKTTSGELLSLKK